MTLGTGIANYSSNTLMHNNPGFTGRVVRAMARNIPQYIPPLPQEGEVLELPVEFEAGTLDINNQNKLILWLGRKEGHALRFHVPIEDLEENKILLGRWTQLSPLQRALTRSREIGRAVSIAPRLVGGVHFRKQKGYYTYMDATLSKSELDTLLYSIELPFGGEQ